MSVRSHTPGIVWDRSQAALGAVYALPAAVAMLSDPPTGLALATGVLPAAIVGLAPTRRARRALVVLGTLIGVPLFLGSLLANVPWLAVAAIGGLGVATAWLAARSRFGFIAMTLSLPMIGVGLSYTDVGQSAGLAGLMIAGSIYACLVSMLWPEHPQGGARPQAAPPTLEYGVRLGAAGATAAAIGFIAGLEHVGWACAAALLVMRPSEDMQRLRSVGRIAAVAAGALAAVALVRIHPPVAVYSAAAILAVGGAAATNRSRWYVTSAFTTFLVFLLLLYATPEDAGRRFDERLGETLLGVAIAYVFGLALPELRRRRTSRDETTRSPS
ncbi:MAG TPA: FUSC family protein [Conexibacter sp.]|nr:FUSC family protein [Conexibacter sp.]